MATRPLWGAAIAATTADKADEMEDQAPGARDTSPARDVWQPRPAAGRRRDMTSREAAVALGISERSVRRAIANGWLIADRQGSAYRIARDEVSRFAAGVSHAPAPRLMASVVALPSVAESAAVAPEPLSSFVGREKDVAAVTALLRDPAVRLLTLTGPGGIGKTRLAQAAAASAAARFPDGVAFVALESVPCAEHLVPAIAQALGLREQAAQARLPQVQTFLRHKRLLLLLDNFEQILDAAPQVAALLATAPAITALITSRAPLRVGGEHELPVPPLTQAGARATAAEVLASGAGRLFVERARAQLPTFTLDDESASIVADICIRLDGLPLAIELAAARVKALPPRQMLARLERRLPLLTRGARDAPLRHGTMRDAIAWSYDLLSREEQALFCRLAVFVGGFTLDAAEAIGYRLSAIGQTEDGGDPNLSHVPRPPSRLSPYPPTPLPPSTPSPITHHPSPSTLDTIESLIDQSLLASVQGPDGQPRFRMLETIREFGREQLAQAGEDAAARMRHARYFLALARTLWPWVSLHARQAPLDQLAAEDANLQTALAWLEEHGPADAFVELAAALSEYWFSFGLFREGQRWLQRALGQIDRSQAHVHARLLAGFAGALMGQAQFTQAAPFLTRALPLSREAGDAHDIAWTLILLGALLNGRGNYRDAEQPLHEAIAQAERIDDPARAAALAGRALANLSISARGQGESARATEYSEHAIRLYAGHGLDLAESISLMDLGACAYEAGDHASAVKHWHAGLAQTRDRGDMRQIADALSGIAGIATLWGDHRAALLLFGAAEALRERVGAAMLWQCDVAATSRALTALRGAAGELVAAATLAEGRMRSLAEAEAIAASVTRPRADLAPAAGRGSELTRREMEVLHRLAERQSDREIAEALFLSRRTVQWHVRAILDKLGVTSRGMAVTRARECGLI